MKISGGRLTGLVVSVAGVGLLVWLTVVGGGGEGDGPGRLVRVGDSIAAADGAPDDGDTGLAALPSGSTSTATVTELAAAQDTTPETATTDTTAAPTGSTSTATTGTSGTTAAPPQTTTGLPPADAPDPVTVPAPQCSKLIGPERLTTGVRYLLAVTLVEAPDGLGTFASRAINDHRAAVVRVALSVPEPAPMRFEVTSDTPLCSIGELVEVASMTLGERGGDLPGS